MQSEQAWWKEATVTLAAQIRPWEMANGSRFWLELRILQPILRSSTTFRLGRGTTIQFWHDDWLQGPLSAQFPCLYQHAADKDGSMADYWQEGEWHITLTGTLELQVGNELSCLQQMLSSARPIAAPDEVLWSRNATGQLTSKLVYTFVHNTPHVQTKLYRLWEIKAPHRVQVFMWLMLRNKLLTIDNLIARDWVITSICYLCRQHQESAKHIFTECLCARQQRAYISDTVREGNGVCDEYTGTNPSEHLILSGAVIYWRQLEATTT
jgi:zinc-binding in reverse transcriptase